MIYTHAPTDPLILQQTIEARETQMLTMSRLIAELNEKLSQVEANNETLNTENNKIRGKLDALEQILAQELQDKKIIEAKTLTITKQNSQYQKKIEEEMEANKENINPIGMYFPIGGKEKKPKWSLWSKKIGRSKTIEYNFDELNRQIPSLEKKLSADQIKTVENKMKKVKTQKESANQEEEGDPYSDILNSIRHNLEVTIPEL